MESVVFWFANRAEPGRSALVSRGGHGCETGRVHAWAGDVTLDIVRIVEAERDAVAEWVMRGIQDAPIAGRIPVATGRPFEIHGVTLVTLDDSGRISRAADYMDVLGFVLQLGSEVIVPGGVRLGPPQP